MRPICRARTAQRLLFRVVSRPNASCRAPIPHLHRANSAPRRQFHATCSRSKEIDLEDAATGERAAALRAVEELDDLEERTTMPDLAPGDFVEVRRGGRVYVGVLAKVPEYDSFASEYHTILYNGHFLLHKAKDVTFQAPKWAYTKIVQSAIPSDFATAGLSPESAGLLAAAGIPTTVVAHVEKFREAADGYAFKYRNQLSRAYRYFSQTKDLMSVTLDSVARWAFYGTGEAAESISPTPAELYAVYNYLLKNIRYYKPVKPGRMREEREFILRPQGEVEQIGWMWEQVRAAGALDDQTAKTTSHALRDFLTKARNLIQWHRESSKNNGNQELPKPSVKFTATDHLFLGALKDASIQSDVFPSPYRTVVLGGILKALYPLYGNKPGQQEALQMLKEIGVWTPWENISMYKSSERGRMVTLEGHGMSDWADAVAEEVQVLGRRLLEQPEFQYDEQGKLTVKTSAVATESKAPDGKKEIANLVKSMVVSPTDPTETSFYAADPCVDIRRDFASLPVYVIDDPTAHELDDGMSIEETPEGIWVHVHIADPTAYIPPSHPLSLSAQLRGNSVYLPERHYPMMPDFLSNERFNLGISHCAMTFSARIAEDGTVADFDVKPSIVRNIKIVHYDNVDEILDWSKVFGVGQAEHERAPWVKQVLSERKVQLGIKGDKAEGLDDNGVKALRKLQQTMQRVFSRRLLNGAFIPDQPAFRMGISPYPQPFTPLTPLEPYFPPTEMSPSITLTAGGSGHLSPSHLMVAECMVLAGRIAAKWCSERQVPAIYRGQPKLLDHVKAKNLPYKAASEVLAQALQSQDAISGIIPFNHFRKLLPYMPGAVMDVKPLGHYSMGIPGVNGLSENRCNEMLGYVKVTSPLRRYKDMVVHWNMKAHMLGKKVPFGTDAVIRISEKMRDVERRTKVLDERTERYWVCEWMRRREIFARRGQKDIAEGSTMPYVDFREAVDDRREGGLTGKGIIYNALVTGVEPKSGTMWVILTELGGVVGRVGTDRNVGLQGTGTKDMIGKLIKVSVERVDPARGNLSVRVDSQ